MASSMINVSNLTDSFKDFNTALPFSHCVIDNFLKTSFAAQVATEFPSIDSDTFNGKYNNAIELKYTCNIWDKFPENTYKLLSYLNSLEFTTLISTLTRCENLHADIGLHGGGWHTHPPGGKLNPHLDYNIHPKLGLQRKFNLLIYLTPDWNEIYGGDFGLWNSDASEIVKTISPLYNRAIFFDTTQDSWHGLATEVSCPIRTSRNSIAVYYLVDPPKNTSQRKRALFAPTTDQQNNEEVIKLIKRRSEVSGLTVSDWERT